MRLTRAMVAAARATPAGKYLDKLIGVDVEKTGGRGFGQPIIEQLWQAMMRASKLAPKKDGEG